MKRQSVRALLSVFSICVLVLLPAVADAQVPRHRYSFSHAPGDATNQMVTDSIGSAHGTVLGAGASFTGTELNMPGGASASAAYVDLPNGLVSSLTDVTFEGWNTVEGEQNWQRLFDFGSSDIGGMVGGEVVGPGGGGEGLDYIMLSASRGLDINLQRAEVRNIDSVGGGPAITSNSDSGQATSFGQPFHWALVYDANGGGPSTASFTTYRDGVSVATGTTDIQLNNLNDVNNWLGRSNWTGDANFQGLYDEFRIYDEALDDDAVAASFAAGPDTIVPEPGAIVLVTLGVISLLSTRRRTRVAG